MSTYKTPGVYIKEQDAFSSSVVAVPTAVPAFIGYTEKARRGKIDLTNKPTRITSLAEYLELFGAGPSTTYQLNNKGGGEYDLSVDKNSHFILFNSMRIFFANGGGASYIISVGGYDYKKGVDAADFNSPGKGLDTLSKEMEPTMVLAPEAVEMEEADCYSLYQAMLQHCGARMRSRVAILDVHNGHQELVDGESTVLRFRNGVGNNQLQWGAAYYPWLNTTITTAGEVDYRNVSNPNVLIALLNEEAERNLFGSAGAPAGTADPHLADRAAANGLIDSITEDNYENVLKDLASLNKGFSKPKAKDIAGAQDELRAKAASLYPAPAGGSDDPRVEKLNAIKGEIAKLGTESGHKSTHQTILAISPLYKDVLTNLRQQLNVLPPAAAMAGVYSLIDSQEGVHKAPANVSLSEVTSPTVNITAEDQEELNLPLNGKAVNAIRSFIGKGVLVWGARTLDGNSQDWRYISVRRTLIMIEQSIKNSVEAYVFENNNARTWIKIKTSIQNFLTEVWKQGSLAGATPADAYEVNVGLGATMTPVDILEGMMRISVKVAITRPAEFIEITFQQKMQES
jgi:hypothetical protein